MINVSALAEDVGLPERKIKQICRDHGVIVYKGNGYYLVDAEDFYAKLEKGSRVEKKRTLTKSHQKKMMEGKAKKN